MIMTTTKQQLIIQLYFIEMRKLNQKVTLNKSVTPRKPKRPQQVVRQSISILKTEMKDIKVIYKQEIGLLQQKIQRLQQQNQMFKKEISQEKSTRQKQTSMLTLTKRDKSPCNIDMSAKKKVCSKCYQQRLNTQKQSESRLYTPTKKSPQALKKYTPSRQKDQIMEFMKEMNKYLLKDTAPRKQLPQFIKEWSQTMMEMVHDLEDKIKKGISEINKVLKTHNQQLLSSFSHQTQQKLSSFHQSSAKLEQNDKRFILEMPAQIKELKQSCGAREQNYKRQIDILQKQLIQESQNNSSIVAAQQAQIIDLRNRLSHLANTYHEHIQIPINAIRQQIQGEISKAKAELLKLHSDRSLNEIINSLISTIKKFLDYKNEAMNGKMEEEIKKMSLKLSEMKDKGMQTLEKIINIIKDKDFQLQNTPRQIESSTKVKEYELVTKKKDQSYQQLQYKCSKQKQYLTALQKYNNKLQESVRRNSNQKSIFEEWAKYQEEFRTRQKQFNAKSDQVAAEFRQAQVELIDIKKNLLVNIQANRDVISMFDQFQVEVSSIQSFKDELFNYLEKEIKLSKAIQDEVQIFNSIFVTQFNKFSGLQTSVPKIQKVELIQQTSKVTLQLAIMTKQDTQNYINFKKEYLELFKDKRVIEARVGKSLVALTRMHDQYLTSPKDKQVNISISMDQKLLKEQWERVNHNIEYISSGVRTIREYVAKNMQALTRQCDLSNQHIIKLVKLIPKSSIASFLNQANSSSKRIGNANGSLISFQRSQNQQ